MATARLGIDFGTSNTVAVLRRPDGVADALLFDGSPTLPSAVFAAADGELLTGRDAVFSSRSAPERFEPNPKLRIDDGTLLLGAEVAVVDLLAAVLRRVAAEARPAAGAPFEVVLTHPAGWGAHRQGVLTEAAARAGLGPVTLVPEPVAAAAGLSPAGAPVLVYDLGGGTFDVAVVESGRVLTSDGLLGVGGIDIDAAIVEHLAAADRDRDPETWARLAHPSTRDERQARRQFAEDVRTAKEMLSRTSQTHLHVPGQDLDTPFGREELDRVARPLIARTIAVTRAAVAAIAPAAPSQVLLIGGGSRMPLVATMLHQALGVAPVVGPRPELAVAHGAVHLVAPTPRPTMAYRDVAAPPRSDPPAATPIPAAVMSRSPARLRRLSMALAIVAVLAVAFAVVMSALSPPPENTDTDAILAKAENAAVALFSYDYRDFDASKRNGLAYMTGTFAEDYGRNMDAMREQTIAVKSVVTASVSEKGLVSAGPEEATVLVFVDQTRRTPDVSGEKIDTNRVELTMVPADGTWKVSAVLAL